MAGRWLTRQSEKILAELEHDESFWPWMLDEVSSGKTPKKVIEQVRDGYALTWGALWRWINSDETRAREWAEAKKAQAEWLEYERIDIADAATPDDVAVAKLQSETRHSIAGKLDRSAWGEKVEITQTKRYVIEVPAMAGSAAEWQRLSVPGNLIDVMPSIETSEETITV
jgi:hypothetical protein